MKKKISKGAADLIYLCNKQAEEIYGKAIPKRVEERIAKEAGSLDEIGLAGDMYAIASIMHENASGGTFGLNVGLRDSAGSLLTAYLCGLSPFNPLEYMNGKFYPDLYFDKMKERVDSGKVPTLVLNVSRQQYNFLKNRDDLPEHIIIRNSENLSLLEKLQNLTGEVYFPSDGIRSIGDRSDDLRMAIFSARKRGLDFWDLVPFAKDNKIIRALSFSRFIGKVTILAKAVGISYGTGTWIDNVELAYREETENGIGFDLGRDDIISCVEDVYENEDCHSDTFDQNLKRIKYLFGRPECVTAAIEIKRLTYYWNRFPDLYLSAFGKIIKKPIDIYPW